MSNLNKMFNVMFGNRGLHPQLEFLQGYAAIFVFINFIEQQSKHVFLRITDDSIACILQIIQIRIGKLRFFREINVTRKTNVF